MLDIHLVLRDVVRCEEELLGKLPDGTGDGTDDVREAPDEDGNQTRLVVLQRNRDQLHEDRTIEFAPTAGAGTEPAPPPRRASTLFARWS